MDSSPVSEAVITVMDMAELICLICSYLEDDKVTLAACILVNSRWADQAVRCLWRSVYAGPFCFPGSQRLPDLKDLALISPDRERKS